MACDVSPVAMFSSLAELSLSKLKKPKIVFLQVVQIAVVLHIVLHICIYEVAVNVGGGSIPWLLVFHYQ